MGIKTFVDVFLMYKKKLEFVEQRLTVIGLITFRFDCEILREDEHQLIAQYCRSLNGDMGGSAMGTSAPRSPVQLLAALDSNHKEEIETMIR